MKKNLILLVLLIIILLGLGWLRSYFNTPVSSIPTRPAYSSGTECEWKWEGGLSIGFWREQCNFSTGLWTIAESDSDTYVLTITDEEGTYPYDPVIDVFTKDPHAPIQDVYEMLLVQKLVPENAQCSFELSNSYDTYDQFILAPFGDSLVQVDAANARGEVPEDVCGAYGSGQADRHFNVYKSHPEKVIFINNGQDGSFFDESTIEVY